MLEILGNTELCEGESTILEASSGYDQYVWMPGNITNMTLETNISGIYTLTAITINGCETTTSIEIIESSNFAVDLQISTPINCTTELGNISSNVSGGVSPYEYLWNNGTQDPSLEEVGEGNYILTVTDAFGCELTESILLEDNSNLEIFMEINEPLCPNEESGNITISIIEGSAPFTYTLNGTSQPDSIFSNLSIDDYEIIVEDANGCIVVEQVNFVEPLNNFELTINAISTLINLGDSVQLIPVHNLQVDTFFWEIINGSSDQINAINPFVTPYISTEYQLTIIDINGCVICLLYTSPSPRDATLSRMPSSA